MYSKLDAALASALSLNPRGELTVFIGFVEPLSRESASELEELGLSAMEGQEDTSAELEAKDIDALSELPCVRSIRLSGRSRLLAQGISFRKLG
jgi:hypothetical protein